MEKHEGSQDSNDVLVPEVIERSLEAVRNEAPRLPQYDGPPRGGNITIGRLAIGAYKWAEVR